MHRQLAPGVAIERTTIDCPRQFEQASAGLTKVLMGQSRNSGQLLMWGDAPARDLRLVRAGMRKLSERQQSLALGDLRCHMVVKARIAQ